MATARELDVVVFGTGYAATRVVERLGFLTKHGNAGISCERGLKVGLAGRSMEKIQAVRSALQVAAGEQAKIFAENLCPGIIANVNDHASLLSMASRCRCVINCVGPYMEFGESVLVAAIEVKSNLVDLSGETEWIDEMTKRYDAKAREAGVIIVSAAGWDSVPSDGLAWSLRSQLSERERACHVTLQILMYMGQRKSFFGSFGGMGAGTLKTVLLGWHTGKGIDFFADPNPVVPASKRLLSQPSEARVEYFPEFGLYGVRSELFSDSYVVRASNKQAGDQEAFCKVRGKGAMCTKFEYNHYFAAPLSPIAYAISFFLWFMPKILRFGTIFKFLMLFFKSGSGPSVSGRDNARASLHGVLKVFDPETRKHLKTITAVADVEHDPNDVTAMVLLRSAAILAKEQHKLAIRGGCVTTATAFQGRILQVLEPATTIRGGSSPII